MKDVKDLLAAEKQVTFEIDDFTIIKGLTLLIAACYVSCNIESHLLAVVFILFN